MNVLVKIVSVISSNVKETLGYEPLDLNVDLQEIEICIFSAK